MIYELKPIFTYNLWGGNKLSKIYNINKSQYGEAWILSLLNNRNSPIKNLKNKTLLDIFNKDKDIVKKGYKGKFPLLIKLIDANDDLSIQVHPKAKTEFWYVLNSNPSRLYLGFKKDTNKNKIKSILEKGDITKSLNHIEAKEGNNYLIKPGTIHAIGKKTFLIEIQQSADITYRLYDFHRVDKNGKERELHIPQALNAINYKKYLNKKVNHSNYLVKCPFFTVYHELINKERTYTAKEDSFHSFTVIKGRGSLIYKMQNINLKPFSTIFVPASSGKYLIKGNLEIIRTTL